jgi:nitroimidazol reductase NimA-like FMN-containing flavoprotein (pyridoxamine 5'-phosphate oxidase superfamily)
MAETSSPGSDALAAIESLSDDECRLVLARQRLCTMSLVDDAEPYAVPVFYGFDGATLHIGLAEGRKTRVLDANPRVCITVTEVGPGDAWVSVQVTGTVEWIDGDARAASVRVLMEHNRRVREVAAASAGTAPAPPSPPRRHGGGRILRVVDPQVTGRARR